MGFPSLRDFVEQVKEVNWKHDEEGRDRDLYYKILVFFFLDMGYEFEF